jgi:S-adenosylmethionine hydrolase
MPAIVLLTDFGGQDHYVGVVKGVILGIAPQAQMIDLSHDLPPYEPTAAQFLLTQATPYFPPGTIYLVIVDPGVGGTRRPIALQTPTGHLCCAG